jgi:hypothetical protein
MNTGHHTYWADHRRQGGDGHLGVNTVRTVRGPARPVYILYSTVFVSTPNMPQNLKYSPISCWFFFTKIV